MIKKHFTLRRTAASFLIFLSIFFAGFSCQDHEVPEVPEVPQEPGLAKIQTVSATYGGATNIVSYTVQFEDLGNVPVIEYGIVSYAGEINENHVPDVPAAPYGPPFYERQFAFSEFMPATLNAVTITRPFDQQSNSPTRLFYRAYAIHSNNAVVYGEVKYVDFLKGEDAIINPVIKTLDATKADGSDAIAYSLQFDKVGNIPVIEYGIVIYQGKQSEQQIPEVPTDSPLEKSYPFSGQPDLTKKSVVKFYNGPLDDPQIRVFYRAYATLINGEVVYGEVKFLDFLAGPIKPVINTLEATYSTSPQINSTNFRVNFTEIGTAIVTEYGTLFAISASGDPIIPEFPLSNFENDVLFESANNGLQISFGEKIISWQLLNLYNKVFYRAYCKLQGGEIIYGDVKFLDFTPKLDIGAVLSTQDATITQLNITYTQSGSLSIQEYGIVYKAFDLPYLPGDEAYLPKIGVDQTYYFTSTIPAPATLPKTISEQTTIFLPRPKNDNGVLLRTFAKLSNGQTVYGPTVVNKVL